MSGNIYLAQFGTGTTINLLPLAAGQLYARLKQEHELLKRYGLKEIIFRREDPSVLAEGLADVAIIGFSCFLWNLNISLQTAEAVRARFPDALIVLGGPAVPKNPQLVTEFFNEYPHIDVICTGEGEDVFVQMCIGLAQRGSFDTIPGIIYRERLTGIVKTTSTEVSPCMDMLPSPFLDGTFDDIYEKYRHEFSGICWETNRGCPYECTYCTWGNLPSHQMRMKPMEQVRGEIEWIGQHKVKYIAMADSNFGIMSRDVEIANLLAACNQEYGFPKFISVSWAKHASKKVIEIGCILKKAGIGFRVTLSLQSLNKDVVKAIKRSNYSNASFRQIKEEYHRNHFYSYTELILGLPLETYTSYLGGIEQSLSESVFEQLYVYPLFLFPNTDIGTAESREKYGLQSRIVPNRYTKSKEMARVAEYVEIVVGTTNMPGERWIDAFVEGYYTLALHDDRLVFFILRYLNKECGVIITDLISYARKVTRQGNLPTIHNSFMRLENCARSVQREGKSHLIEPDGYNGIPFDPPDGIFLELLLERVSFYDEFEQVVRWYLAEQNKRLDERLLHDLFLFQKIVMAHPVGPLSNEVVLQYDWPTYFGFTFGQRPAALKPREVCPRVIDSHPSKGDPLLFLNNHFDVRGVPPFNTLLNEEGAVLFPMAH